MFPIALISILPIVVIVMAFFVLVKSKKKLEFAKADFEEKMMASYDTIEKISADLQMYKERAEELEDAREKGYGVKARVIVEEVKTEFKKIEWVVIVAGVNKLLGDSKNPEDIKLYLKILERIDSFIMKMKEEDLDF